VDLHRLRSRSFTEIDDKEFEVAAGDFMGFSTSSVARQLRNLYDEDRVYLVGVENLDVEIADFPRLGKRMLRRGRDVEVYEMSGAKSFGPLDA